MAKLHVANSEELKLLLSTINATPTPGYCSSFGWYWYTVNYKNSDIILIITTNHEDKTYEMSIYEDDVVSDIIEYISEIYKNKNYTGDRKILDNSWSCPKGFQPATKEQIDNVKKSLGNDICDTIGLR